VPGIDDIYRTTLESETNLGILSGKTNKSQLDGLMRQPFAVNERKERSQERRDADRSKSKGRRNGESRDAAAHTQSFQYQNNTEGKKHHKMRSVDKLIKKNIR